jgi:hypothetical protein
MQIKKYFVGNSLFLAIFDKSKFGNILYCSGMTEFGGNSILLIKWPKRYQNVTFYATAYWDLGQLPQVLEQPGLWQKG